MILVIECVMACMLFTLIIVPGTLKAPLAGLHNLPMDIQERVHEMPAYQGKACPILKTWERIKKKNSALVILMLIMVGLMYTAGAVNFVQGFLYAFVFWAVLKLYVAFVLQCGWYAHCKSAWIPGTEDMVSSYQNYRFYVGSIPRSLLAGAIVAVIIGGIIQIIS